ncbi:sugar ABC transporter permease [Limnochorda pilosa]|uniref:Sugar ABC transporter permease n=1 Tax=Limnochorda pilosa TaxID=1555112 RepID=A0A0K2SJM0_LIMPI|nr:sugar ABC transporter permease [Limnochorda pilosa]BAS27049.1 sugar ABC transporter permease [Limnochorda pilosa]
MYRRPGLLGQAWRQAVVLAAMAFALFPIVWIFSASLSPSNTLVSQSLIPRAPTFQHYVELFTSPVHPFSRWLWNSVKISSTVAVLTVAMAALAAYAFARFRFRGRRAGLVTLLIIQMFPQMLTMVALYLLLLAIGEYVPSLGLDTHGGLILVYLGGAVGFNAYVMKGYFDTIPRSLEESAMLDGATTFQAFWHIILPVSRPVLAVVFMLVFILTYSDFLLASILLKDRNVLTLAVGLRVLIAGQYHTRWGMFAAGALLGALPVAILFYLLRNQFISGLTQGAVKG